MEHVSLGDVQHLVEGVKEEWKRLWLFRIDDKVRAEGLANREYPLLFVEQGTVIVATRDFRLLSLREILELHLVENSGRYVSPYPSVGGWGKFVRTVVKKQSRTRRWQDSDVRLKKRKKKVTLQAKKGGRGWLHCHSRR